ncbi:cell division protein FtsB [uncultured Methylibium sp.]|uniref:cell division protein FtsB n=1 Tax=uncultured Methylibium sp. TaxID=381093 RepID=UPI0025EE942B|nr:cell division protein FtsB [uncultured Methylibium sp.]
MPRFLSLALVGLLALVHAELWFGKSGMGRVVGLQAQVDEQRRKNDDARARNDRLMAEVRDLKEGLEMVEEKARFELGMVKADEIYVRIAPPRR